MSIFDLVAHHPVLVAALFLLGSGAALCALVGLLLGGVHIVRKVSQTPTGRHRVSVPDEPVPAKCGDER